MILTLKICIKLIDERSPHLILIGVIIFAKLLSVILKRQFVDLTLLRVLATWLLVLRCYLLCGSKCP